VVKEAIVGEGPTLKRMTPRARGSGSQILKRTSHIRIVLSDEIQIETRETRKSKREQEKKELRKQAIAGEKPEKSAATAKASGKSNRRRQKPTK
jgi:large subunit ribosomal protein L22